MGIEQIKYAKQNTDIVEVIGRFVKLKKKGANYVGLSPFVAERTPSFVVSPVKKMFTDFASGKKGDIFDFLMIHKGWDMQTALNYLGSTPPPKDFVYTPPPELPIDFMSSELVRQSTKIRGFGSNFHIWFKLLFPISGERLLNEYSVGESKHWPGSTIFWQIDKTGNVRSGKIILYDVGTGKRVKDPFPHITWVHKLYKDGEPLFPTFNLSSCLFGEHLLNKYPDKPIGLVESEKSAIVATTVYPEQLWLATGSLTNISLKRCECILNRQVTMYPDVGGEEQWVNKAKEMGVNWTVVKLNGAKGWDICDEILKKKI